MTGYQGGDMNSDDDILFSGMWNQAPLPYFDSKKLPTDISIKILSWLENKKSTRPDPPTQTDWQYPTNIVMKKSDRIRKRIDLDQSILEIETKVSARLIFQGGWDECGLSMHKSRGAS